VKFDLPFPPASLSGHNKGAWYGKSPTVAKYRGDAEVIATDAKWDQGYFPPLQGDIPISFTFHPADDRGDRVNFAIRIKPQIDGIAAALGVNDKRFLPSYHFAPPQSPGRVEIVIGETGE
jgi:hypothetical protein